MLSFGVRNAEGSLDRFPASVNHCMDKLSPLKELQLLTQPAAATIAPTHVVLSVGGNDIRHILGDMSSLPQVMATLQANYARIVERRARRGVMAAQPQVLGRNPC